MDRRSDGLPIDEHDELLYDEDMPVIQPHDEAKPMSRDEAREYNSGYDEP